MKKVINIVILLISLAALAGCEQESVPEVSDGYIVYRMNSDETKLVEEEYIPTSESRDELISELLLKLIEAPAAADKKSVYPENMERPVPVIQDENNLRIDLSEQYRELDPVHEVLVRAGLVKTIIQIPGVDSVSLSISGQELADAQGNPLGRMNAESFLDARGEGINPYQYASLALYFPDESGQHLVREMRNVHYSSNNTLEKVVIEQILKGPENSRLQAAIPQNTVILGVNTVNNGVCTVNFSEAFLDSPVGDNITAEAVIYSVVNSLFDSSDISTVQFQIEGQRDVVYGQNIDLSQALVRNGDIINQPESTATEESTAENPSVGIDQVIPN